MVVDLQYCPRQQMLHALHGLWPDGLITEAIRSRICCWDMATECSTATMYEFLEQYELACFCIPDQDAAANELVAGAVTSGDRCLAGAIATMSLQHVLTRLSCVALAI